MLKSDEHVLSRRCLDRIDEDIQRLDSSSDRGVCAWIVKRCSNARAIEQGRRIHAHIASSSSLVSTDSSSDAFLLNLLVEMYGKCSSLEEARLVFDGITHPNVFSWTIMLAAYAQNGHLWQAVHLLRRMDQEGVKPNGSTFVAIATAATADLLLLRSIHARATATGARDLVLDNVMLDSFARLGALELARSIFDDMEEKTLISWNAIIGAYARLGREDLALVLFRAMDLDGVRHNRITFINAIGAVQSIDGGEFLHERAAAAGFEGDIAVRNALVSMYGRCGSSAMARRVFDAMERRTRVTWTAMISAYAHNGHSKEALELFFEAVKSSSPPLDLDALVFVSALEAGANVGDLDQGILIHEKIIESSVAIDTLLTNSVINMYAKCGSLAKALEVFKKISSPGVIAWNTIISAYAQAGHSNDAIEMFHRMDLEGIKPDGVTFMVLLEAMGSNGSLQDGNIVHSRVTSLGFDERNTSLCNALLNLYTRYGSMPDAIALFHKMPTPNQISWTCCIAGYAQQGHSTEALELYQKMDLEGAKANQVTLLGVLTACTHAGLVEDGIYYYYSMVSDHSIQPKEEHYGCLVDMLARAGWLQEAEALIETLPFYPFAVAWTSLLGASCNHKDVDRAERVAAKAIEREPCNAGPYICLSNMYATLDRWDDVARVKELINRGKKVKKVAANDHKP